MSDAEIDALLQAEGLEHEGADALLEWARSRAAELVAQTQGDPELGPLLREGGQAGVDERATRRRGEAAEADVDRPARRGRGREAQAEDDDRPARRGRGRGGKRRGREREAEEQAQAQADVVGEAHEGEAASVPVEAGEAGAAEREPEWKATMHGEDAPEPAHRYEDEVTTPRGEGSSAGPLPPIPSSREPVEEEEIDEIEELDAEELEMLDEEPAAEAPAEPAADAPTFGPPDGTDEVPAWRAALLAAETGSDREAAELIKKEESGMRPLPATVTEPTIVATERLQAEEDEISQHKIDLSDLDGAPE